MDFDLTDGQRVALNLIYEPFKDGGDWPQQRYVEKALRRHGLALDSVFQGMPQGLMAPDANAVLRPTRGSDRTDDRGDIRLQRIEWRH